MMKEVKETKVPNTGALPSRPDYRDVMAAGAVYDAVLASKGDLPSEFVRDITNLGEALDQNKIPACVAHAWALVMKYWWHKKTGEVVEFSPRFLDIMSDESWIPEDGGRVPRTVCKVSAKYGCCTVATLPNDTEKLSIAEYRNKAVITDEVLAEAAKYKIPGYIRVPDDETSDFREAIAQLGLVSGLFSISDAFWNPSWRKEDIDPLQARPSTVRHQMVVKGWEQAYNVLQNSWGPEWNTDGDGRYKASTWLNYIWEGWSIADVPNDVKTFLSDLPKPWDFKYQWNKNLRSGEYSDDVKMAQIAFLILGIMKPFPADQLGWFGPKTEKAVLAYQLSKKIYPTAPGSIGPKTRAALNAQFAV